MPRTLILTALLAAPALAQTTRPDSFSTGTVHGVVVVTGDYSGSLAALRERVRPSLVVVKYTWNNEFQRNDLEGTGVVVAADGTVMTSVNFFLPTLVPDGQIVDVKVVVPSGVAGPDELEVPATFLGRDGRTDTAFVRADLGKAKDVPAGFAWAPLSFDERPPAVGERVSSVGLLPEGSGYHDYVTIGMLSAHLRGPTPLSLVTGGGLGPVGSPVFDAGGSAIGVVAMQSGQSPFLNVPGDGAERPLQVPPKFYVPTRDFAAVLTDLPTEGKPRAEPYLGIAEMTGLEREVAEQYGVAKGTHAIQVGEVVKGSAAERAGLKGGDLIVRFRGEALERGDLPEELPLILVRKIERLKPGDEVELGVISGTDAERAVTLTLGEKPAPATRAERFYAEDLGFVARATVFDDLYARKLAPDFGAVHVAQVRPSSAAESGGLQGDDLVTKVNQTAVKDLAGFRAAYEAARKDQPREAVVFEVRRGVQTDVVRIEPGE